MKKLFTLALAAATLAGFSACSNDEQHNIDSTKGYINLGVTTDNTLATRAIQDAPVAKWYAVVTNEDGDYVYGTAGSKDLIGTTLSTKPLAAGSYNVAVANFATNDAWLTANDGFGAAYYEGNASEQTVTAGQTTDVDIDCGKAKNAKFNIVSSGFSGTALTVNVTAPRTLTFDKTATPSTIGKDAFFAPKAQLTYTITYTINGNTKTSDAKTITLGEAGSASTLTIKSNKNGTISVSITYDDAYNGGTTDEIEIDAATGDEVVKP